jgi:triacylglycerol lipase
VRALITLGTPHNGSLLAFAGLPFAFLARSVAQMTPLSSLIRELRDGEWPGSVHLTSIYSHQDRVALHPAALVEALDLPHVRNVRVEGTHREFLYDRRIYDVILRELRACGQPGAPVAVHAVPPAANAAVLLESETSSTRRVGT